MRILSRLPADLTTGIRALDPMHGRAVETPPLPPQTHDAPRSVSHHDHEDRVVLTAADRRPPRRRMRVVAAAATVAAAGTLVGVAVAHWPTSSTRPAVSVSTAGPPDGVSTDEAKADAARLRAWTTFPVDRSPRPLVLLQPDVVDPAGGFPDGDIKEAYLDHRIRLATAVPTSPAQADGYMVRSAADAVAALTGGAASAAVGSLAITGLTLDRHVYTTDRGDVELPAWAVSLAGIEDPAYVLAVAADDRFAFPDDGSSWFGARHVAVRGNQLTFALTARHTSTDPCDASYTQTAAATGSAAFVELAITTTTVTDPPASAVPSDLACGLEQILTADPPLVPGTPGTETIALTEDLGNRPVVDARGVPWQVTVVG